MQIQKPTEDYMDHFLLFKLYHILLIWIDNIFYLNLLIHILILRQKCNILKYNLEVLHFLDPISSYYVYFSEVLVYNVI